MRLITLVLALAIIGGLLVYNKNSLLPGGNSGNQTVKQQANQIIDNAKQSSADLQKQLQAEQKKIQQDGK